MGRTVEELMATISDEEYHEWMAYYLVEPFGPPADDDRARQPMELFYAANSQANAEMPRFLDRTPSETRWHKSRVTATDDNIEAFFASMVTVKAVVSDPADTLDWNDVEEFDPSFPVEIKPVKRRKAPSR